MVSKTSLKTDSKRKLVESAYIQHLCSKNDVEIIYFDEFSLSARHTSLYGWIKTGSKGYVAQNTDFEWVSSLGSAKATYTESWVRRVQLTQRLQYRVHKRHASKPNDSGDQDF